ncbi:zinc ribbon domain-containing protein [Thalassovita sp.]|uniref:zinc ribbon domain-containing protein n=1 Tax=Thalassovita sp. TaxID=1979401 RepID=UPI003B5A7017
MGKLVCQSCGMPLSKDPKLGGLEKDGAHSQKYCSLCYDDGEFLQPDITATSMQHLVIHALQRQGWPKAIAWLATRRIPKLERWKGPR